MLIKKKKYMEHVNDIFGISNINNISKANIQNYENIENINKEIFVLFSRYVHNIKQQKKIIGKLIGNIKSEKKKPYKYWYSIEDKMINFYINEYLKNKLNTKHTYTISKQIVDLLKLRLLINHSSLLPNSWTEKALCNICNIGEDWEDNPIVFCDCCYTPMHSFCSGSKNIKNYNSNKKETTDDEDEQQDQHLQQKVEKDKDKDKDHNNSTNVYIKNQNNFIKDCYSHDHRHGNKKKKKDDKINNKNNHKKEK